MHSVPDFDLCNIRVCGIPLCYLIWNQEWFFDSVNKTTPVYKLIVFTINSDMFRLLYQSHREVKPL